MNDTRITASLDLIDRIALQIQRLHSSKEVYDTQPLFRIDYRKESAQAPFQFDVVESVLHRSSCTAIPIRSRSALYGLWEIHSDDEKYACEHCTPEPRINTMEKTTTTDLFYGILSILDQFSSVLGERGKEYRNSEKGKQTEATVDRVLHEFDIQQKRSVDFLLGSLDELIHLLRDTNTNGNEQALLPTNGKKTIGHKPRVNGQGNKTKNHNQSMTRQLKQK